MAIKRLSKQQWNSLPAYKKYQMKANTPDLYNYYQKREANVARQKNYGDKPTKDTLDEDATFEGFWGEKAKETTATLQRLLENTGANFLEIQLNMLGKQIVAGAATVENPLVNPDSFINRLGFDVSSGKNKKILTDLFGENDTISAYQLATSLGYTKEQFTSIPAQAQRIAAATPAMRELFKDQDYKATPFELEDAVLNGKTAEEVAEYVDPRYVTEAEAIAAFEAENGYRPSPEEVQDRIGQAEYTDATDAAGQEAYVNRTANHEQAELEDLKYYVDARQITVDEVKDYAAQNGLTISDEEAEKLARQGNLEEIVNEEQKIFDDFDERFVTRAELEGIARAEGYDPASLTEKDYAEFSGETSQSDAVKAIDTRATTEEELIEVFEQRTGIALDPYNPEDREKITDMLEAATAANGGVVPSDAEFKAWTKKNIEYDLGVQVGRLATGVRNAIFGTGPGGRPKTLQEILDELLGPPGTAGFGGKSPLVIKTTPGGAIGAPSTGVFGSPNVQVEIKFPVPLPVNGPPIIVPLYEEGVYVGPSSAGELLVGEDGVITQVKDNVTTTVGRISGQVVQVVGAAGEVVKAIPLGALDNPGWREGDPNPNDLVLDESGNPALIDENGNPLDKETGLPVYEDPDAADADNTFDLEDQDGDGIPDAIDPEVTVGNGEDPETKSPYDSGEASDAFRNSSWPDPDPDAQDTYSRQIEEMFLTFGLDTNQWPEGTELSISTLDGQPVDANEDGVYTVEELAAVGITRAAGYDPRMFLGNDARLVLDTLEGTLDGLGLDVDEIETILGRIETDLQNVTTAEDLETFRTNLITELTDPDTGLPSMGIDADELGDALEPITKAVDDLEGAINDVGRNVGLRAVEDDPNTPDVDESRPATGLYGYIDDAVEAVEGDVEAIVGVADVDGEGNLTKDSTGLYLEFYNAGVDYDTALGLIGNKDEGTGLYGYIDDAVEELATKEDVKNLVGEPEYGVDPDTGEPTTEIVGGTGLYGVMFGIDAGNDAALEAFIGTAPTKDADGNLIGGSGLLLTLAQQDVDIEDLPAEVERIVGVPEYGVDADGEPTDEVIGGTGLYGDMYNLGIDVGRIEGLIGNPEDGNGLYGVIGTPATDDTPGTGLYGYIDTAVQDLATVADVERIVGVPDIDEETGELTDKSTGLYLDFYNAGVDYDTVINLIGVPDNPETEDVNEGRGLFGYVGQSSQDLEDYIDRTFGDVPGQVTEIQGDVNTLIDYVGVPPSVDADGNVIPATGLHELLINNGVAIDALPGIIEGIVGVPEFGVDPDTGEPTTEIVGGTGIYGEVFDLNTDVDTVITSINDTVIPQITEVAGFIGEPATVDEDGNVIPATGLHKIIEDYAGDSELRDGAITDAINKFTSDGAYTIEQVLTAIDTSNTDIKNFIGSPGADVDDPNTPEDETLPTGIYEGIATSEGVITDAIAASEENTTEYLTYISEIIGIPATDLTQEDIDFVVGLIGEDEAITDINNDIRIYDANFDGVINDIDIGLLQGFVDAGVDGVGEIPATGLYADAAQRQLELTGYISDQDDITRGLISDEAKATRGLMGATTLFNAMLGAGDISGTRVDVSTPDPARINYIYDFEDVFATPQQKSLFPSPYGKPQMAQQQQMAQRQSSMSGPLQIGGMAQGGKVDYDFTDEIMQIMRYGDS